MLIKWIPKRLRSRSSFLMLPNEVGYTEFTVCDGVAFLFRLDAVEAP